MAHPVSASVVGPLSTVSDVVGALAGGDLTRRSGLTSRDGVGRTGAAVDTAIDWMRAPVEEISGPPDAWTSPRRLCTTSQEVGRATTASDDLGGPRGRSDLGRGGGGKAATGDQVLAAISEIAPAPARPRTWPTAPPRRPRSRVSWTRPARRSARSGRGPAVVAFEVETLAQETAAATDQIARTVAALRADSSGTGRSIDEIAAAVARTSEFQSTVAAAAEQQDASSDENDRRVATVAVSNRSSTGERATLSQRVAETAARGRDTGAAPATGAGPEEP